MDRFDLFYNSTWQPCKGNPFYYNTTNTLFIRFFLFMTNLHLFASHDLSDRKKKIFTHIFSNPTIVLKVHPIYHFYIVKMLRLNMRKLQKLLLPGNFIECYLTFQYLINSECLLNTLITVNVIAVYYLQWGPNWLGDIKVESFKVDTTLCLTKIGMVI